MGRDAALKGKGWQKPVNIDSKKFTAKISGRTGVTDEKTGYRENCGRIDPDGCHAGNGSIGLWKRSREGKVTKSSAGG